MNATVTIENCIIVTNVGVGVICDSAGSIAVKGCNVYGNTEGDWTGCISDQAGINENMSADPLFCDTGNGDYHINASSPCAPANNSAGVLIGALVVGCTPTDFADDPMSVPVNFALSQNYPNPFNPSTVIEFDVPRRSRIVIDIFNVLGQSVRRLVDDEKPAGTYSVGWNGTDHADRPVSSGIYLYRLTAGDFIRSRKMALMK
jgi:hypothetical protein